MLKTNSATRVPGAPNDLAGQIEPSSNTSLALYESQGFSTRPTRKEGFASFSKKSKALSFLDEKKRHTRGGGVSERRSGASDQ